MKRKTLWWGEVGWVPIVATTVMLLHGLSWAQSPGAVVSGNNHERLGVGTSEAIPFTLIDGYLIAVEVRLGTHRHLKMVLDTGSTNSVLRPRLADEQSFVRRTRIVNLEQVVTQELAEVADFEFGPLRIAHLSMMLNDLTYVKVYGIDGIIGLDVLRLQSFSIDFDRRRITFGSSRTLRSSAKMEMNKAYLAVDVQMLDQPVRLLLDSAVSTILLYRDRMGNRLPELKVEGQIRGTSLGGATSLDVVLLPWIELKGTHLNRDAVLLRNSPAGFLPGLVGYLSLNALGAQRITFDFEKNMFSWE
jgi:Aspartyl protease